jgi:hypothetical protein
MGLPWKNLRVPADLHGELQRQAKHLDRMQLLGKCQVPSEFADPRGGHVGTPLWFVIRRALDELADKRKRSNTKRRGNRQRATPAKAQPGKQASRARRSDT